jgi:hypothetical protein
LGLNIRWLVRDLILDEDFVKSVLPWENEIRDVKLVCFSEANTLGPRKAFEPVLDSLLAFVSDKVTSNSVGSNNHSYVPDVVDASVEDFVKFNCVNPHGQLGVGVRPITE